MIKYTGWILKSVSTEELYLGFFHTKKEDLEKELLTIYSKEEWKKLEEEGSFKIVPVEIKERSGSGSKKNKDSL